MPTSQVFETDESSNKEQFNFLDSVIIVSSHEVQVVKNDQKRQKIVAATGADKKTYFTRSNLLVIGATMVRTKFYWTNYFDQMLMLYKTLYHIDYDKVPTRPDVANAINAVLAKWDKSTDGLVKPFSHEVLKNKESLKLIKVFTEIGIIRPEIN
jgi:hypothetical protein